MTTTILTYLVQIERLRAARGSKDQELLAALPDLAGFFETIDDIARNHDDEDGARPPTCAAAFTKIINGEPLAAEFGYVYGYAYEAICMTIGNQVEPAWYQITRGGNWIEQIDGALASLKIKLSVTNLVYRGTLVKIPEPDDVPCFGWWTAEEMAEAARIFESLEWKKANAVQPVIDALEDIRTWVREAATHPESWLIGVHS